MAGALRPDRLGHGVIACLEEKCGTVVDAVLIAYASGGVGDELHSLGVRDLSSFGGPDVYIPEGRERVVWSRVVDYHGCDAKPTPPRMDAAAPRSNDPPGMKRQPGPDPAFHEPEVIGAALGALKTGGVLIYAVKVSGMHEKDVLRAEKPHRWKLLRWDGATLWADEKRVRQRAGKIALRVLSGDEAEWLDPLLLRISPNPQ